MTTAVRVVLGVIHAGVAAAWVGSMLYSLLVVQPAAQRFFASPSRFEDFATAMASGARPKVLALIGALAASGAGLTVVEVAAADDVSALWLAVLAAKAVLLLAAATTFAVVSWRLWPARLFAAPAELEAVQGRFRRVALGMTGLVGLAFVLGVVADALGPRG